MYATRRTTTEAGSVTLTENEGSWWVELTSQYVTGTRQFDNNELAAGYFKRKGKELEIVEILLEFSNTDASTSEFDRMLGINETVIQSDSFEDVASAIAAKWFLN